MNLQVDEPVERAAKVFLDAGGRLSVHKVAKDFNITRDTLRHYLDKRDKERKIFSLSKQGRSSLQALITSEYEQNGPVSKEFVMKKTRKTPR